MTDTSIIRIAECCHHLEKFDIGFCRNVTDASVIRLAEGCPNMKDLSVVVTLRSYVLTVEGLLIRA
jgi:hypothetical protein